VSAQRRLPTRMIDVFKVCVIDSKNLPIMTPYLTLSHCWGKNPSFVRLTSTTYDEYYNSIPWTLLPQTFKDAVELTQSLGFRYIWIDALCIVQDSESDWQYEAALMGDVYAHGSLNIAATTSNSGVGGILPRGSRPFPHCLIAVTDGAGNSHTFRTHTGEVFPHNIEDPLLAPLGNRAWVVQERLLSPRILHFVSDQVFWECCCSVWAELFDNDYLINADSVKRLMGLNQTSGGPHSASELYHGWIDIVARYSQCGLTQKLDKLPAISGIARRMRRQLGVSPEAYLAGLWRETLPLRLLWFSLTQKGESSPVRYLERAPSWSWSCIEGPIEFCRFHRETEFRTRVLEAKTFHDGDPFSQVSGGSLVLQGPICELASFGYPKSNGVFDMLRTPPAFPADEIQWDSPGTKRAMESSKAVLQFIAIEGVVYYGVLHVSGLVLCLTEEKSDQYRRVGMIGHGRMRNYEAFLNCTIKSGEFGFRNFDPNFGYVIEIV
jgi:hypothetical protein